MTKRPCIACRGKRTDSARDGIAWGLLSPAASGALAKAMAPWVGTPYRAGQQRPGTAGGVDCVRLVGAILDRLYGSRTVLPRTAQDAGVHHWSGARPLVKAMRAAWPCHRVNDGLIYPGDVVVCAVEDGGRVNHAMLAGHVPWTALHAETNAGVCVGSVASARVVAIYRTEQKGMWR